jgi:predicted nucleotide-binding protein
MDEWQELDSLLQQLAVIEDLGKQGEILNPKNKLRESAQTAARAASGSWLGYHAYVYFDSFQIPPPGNHFSSEWGLSHSFGDHTSRGWREYSNDDVVKVIEAAAENPNLTAAEEAAGVAEEVFDRVKEEALAILRAHEATSPDPFVAEVMEKVADVKIFQAQDYVSYLKPHGQLVSRDSLAGSMGLRIPPHVTVAARVFELDGPFVACTSLAKALKPSMLHLKRLGKVQTKDMAQNISAGKIFIGHGGSPTWKDLKDFLQDRLHLAWDEFNREANAGKTTIERITEMLNNARFAFLVMTAEDEQADGKIIARQNVIHEVGLFQGRLGFAKAIILLEDGCDEFSNIRGLTQIRFPKGHISAAFEEIRRTLERENIIPSTTVTKKKLRVL